MGLVEGALSDKSDSYLRPRVRNSFLNDRAAQGTSTQVIGGICARKLGGQIDSHYLSQSFCAARQRAASAD